MDAAVNRRNAIEMRLRHLDCGCLPRANGIGEDRRSLPREIGANDCH
ncbi:unannotated protein [freshwater metagenome]|uniref:Unannotated protein n=1 Tax=freshwater metagenome TaxID=449393 RepID=A0A6J7HP82_9ZZZZ